VIKMSYRRRKPFKACKKCNALVPHDETQCPVCGSRTFSDDWEGLVIIVSSDSKTAKILNKTKPHMYAIKVR